ncbi:MAG: hypothetical protein ACFFB2_03305 [Promethearchaeota archaeon]
MTTHNLYHKILGPYRISHHPLCINYRDHVYEIQGNKVCRGCLMQYSGMLVSFLMIGLGSLLGWWKGITEIQVGFILYILILPTLITAFLIENRRIKDISRFLLGTSFSIAFLLLFFTPNWLIKAFILLNFIPGYIYLNKRRAKQNYEVCNQCSEYSELPYCTGYKIYTDREKIFTTQAIQGGIHDPFALPPDQLEE